MRRLKDAHLPLTLDPTVAAYWPGDLAASSATVPDASASPIFHLTTPTGTAARQVSPFQDTTAAQGAYSTSNNSWLAGVTSSSLAAIFAGCGWSVGMWVDAGGASNTLAFFEFAYGPAPAADSQLRTIGVYRNATARQITWGWDPSTTSTHVYNTGVSAPSEPFHLGVIKEVSPNSNTYAKVTLLVDGKVVAQDESGLWGPTGSGTSAKFILKGSFRLGGSVTSPAFGPIGGIVHDDVALFNTNVPIEKIRDLARNGRRNWNERRLLDGKHVAGRGRVLVEDGDGNFVDLSNYYGTDFVQSIRYKNDVEAQKQTANVRLMRYRGERLNLAPLDELAVNNLNAAGSYESLLEYRRKIKIEYAVYPERQTPEPWAYETLLEGFVDEISWGADSVELGVVDKIAPLEDQFQLDPRFYAYGEVSTTLAETHLQTIINNNVPNIRVGGTAMTFGYKGGTPTVYTPASSGWVLRYDDSQAAPVSQLLQNIADQIGWSIRYRWDQEQQQDRLTFRRPNRAMSLDVAAISNSGSQFWIRTRIPHNLTLEQVVAVTGTVSANFVGNQVQRIPAYNIVVTDGNAGGVSTTTETVGTLGYGAVYTLTDEHVRKFDDVRKDGNSIRNAVVVRHSRTPSTITLPVSELYNDGSGSNVLQIKISSSSPGVLDTLRDLVVGENTFSVTGSSVGKFNVTDHIGTLIPGNPNFYIYGSLDVGGASTVDTNHGVFASDYIRTKQLVAVDTPSINKYGYRPVGIYEAGNSNINTDAEAYSLAQAVLSDLAEPTAAVKVTIPFAPWFELDDYISLAADRKRRWSGTLATAITGVEHTLEGGHCYTELTLRNTKPSLGNAWVDRIRTDELKAALPVRYPGPDLAQNLVDKFQNRLGHQLGGRIQHMARRTGGAREMRRMFTELHIGSNASFAVSNKTLAAVGAGGDVRAHYDPDGNFLRPGSTYYLKYREVDVFGNPAPDANTTAATAQVPRFNEESPMIFATTEGAWGHHSTQFQSGIWNVYPLATFSDAYNLFSGTTVASSTAPLVHNSQTTTAFFKFPATGKVDVELRAGVRYAGGKATTGVIGIGLFRLGSNLPGSGSSRPVIHAVSGPHEFSPSWNSFWYLGTSIGSVLFVRLRGTVSGNSGDYLQVGVFPEFGTGAGTMSDFYGIRGGGSTADTTPYIRIYFTQD